MPFAMRVIGSAAGWHLGEMEGWYVHHVDVQAANISHDWLKLTHNIDDAWLWDSAEDALSTWKEILTSDPVRPDGKPNRPMTAFTVELVKVEKGGTSNALK